MNQMHENTVNIVEVGARDGLQNEPGIMPTADKTTLITAALDAGIKRIEVASFVHPKLVPQMADAEAVLASLPAPNGASYIGLVLNKRGYFRALETRDQGHASGGVGEIGCVAVASDGFGMKNQGQTAQESVQVASEILRLAKADGIPAQVTISTAFGCPFDGDTPQDRVIEIVRQLAEAEPFEIAIADTIGGATPQRARDMFLAAREVAGDIPLRGHFHNTRNTGVASAWGAYEGGARTIDASIGGLGGCPFAPNATGNTATEDIVFMFERSGIATGIDLEKLIDLAHWVEDKLGHQLPGMVSRAGNFPQNQ